MTTVKRFRALGTVNSITVYGPADAQLLARAEQEVLQMDDLWSVFKPGSEIRRLNDAAGREPVKISGRTMDILSAAKTAGALADGDFSVTIGPLSRLWRQAIRTRTLPDAGEIERARALVNDADLHLDHEAGTAMLLRPDMELDLGSIAKGYAADRVRDLLRQGGVTGALLNFGGTVTAIGPTCRVGIQHPRLATGIAMGSLPLTDASVVTSGDYERGFVLGGRRYHHLIDPKTGQPCRSGLCSVSVLGPNAIFLDALSTMLFVGGRARAAQLLQRFRCEAILVTDGKFDIYCTEGLRGVFALQDRYRKVDLAL